MKGLRCPVTLRLIGFRPGFSRLPCRTGTLHGNGPGDAQSGR